jgi:thymidylate synthase (FAD)
VIDPHFRVEVISQTPNPQRVIYAAMHQDYSENFVHDEMGSDRPGSGDYPMQLEEWDAGDLVVKHLLKGGRGHFGPLEHPQIVLNCGWFPHSTMQQMRTHRVGLSFDVQSGRYTSQRFLKAASKIMAACDHSHRPHSEQIAQAVEGFEHVRDAIEGVVYFRPAGSYSDRQGHRYMYDDVERLSDLTVVAGMLIRFAHKIEAGFSEEHARGLMPFDVRQHWVMSANVRSLMHLLDLRWKADAQLECQQLCELIWPHFKAWVPAIADWYEHNRMKKAKLAP